MGAKEIVLKEVSWLQDFAQRNFLGPSERREIRLHEADLIDMIEEKDGRIQKLPEVAEGSVQKSS